MEADQDEKNLERERLVFFSDAVIAIAITLLALDLKVHPTGPHFTYADIGHAWHAFAAFFLSFIIIAVFWVNHHRFFVYIKAIDSRMVIYHMCWLLFIVLLPFTSSLISNDFFDKPAMFMYSINVLLVACFQNAIWDHATLHRSLIKDTLTQETEREYRVGCNLAITNALVAIGVTFLSPLAGFIVLLTRTFTFRQSAQQWVARVTKRKVVKEKMVAQRGERRDRDSPKEN
jgi:uncharacterized membrane protein